MAITEKTLELNVTHEILSNADYLWWLLWGRALRSVARVRGRSVPIIASSPSVYATGLSLRDEERRGYDVCIMAPHAIHGVPRVAFIQFKKGYLRRGTRLPTSVFWTRRDKCPHLSFSINNNSTNNQHRNLKLTARRSGFPSSAIYAFPLLKDESDLKSWLGVLLLRTCFLRATAIDASYHPRSIGLQTHHVAISYSDPGFWEVRSDPMPGVEADSTADVFAELTAVRSHRALLQWSEPYRRLPMQDGFSATIFRTLMLRLSMYLRLKPADAQSIIDVSFSRHSRAMLEEAALGHERMLLGRADSILGDAGDDAFEIDVQRRKGMMSRLMRYAPELWHALRSGEWIETAENLKLPAKISVPAIDQEILLKRLIRDIDPTKKRSVPRLLFQVF